MSENLDLVRSIYADWERGDYARIDWGHEDIECVIMDGPTPGRWKGQAQMADAWRNFFSVWEDWRVAADGYRDLGDGVVLVFESRTARAKISGLEVGHVAGQMRSEGASTLYVVDGKVVRFVTYFDRAQALTDLGLTE